MCKAKEKIYHPKFERLLTFEVRLPLRILTQILIIIELVSKRDTVLIFHENVDSTKRIGANHGFFFKR